MSSHSLESSADPGLAFASETADAPTSETEPATRTFEPEPAPTVIEPEPAFLRAPATSDRSSLTFEPTLTFEPASSTFESPSFSAISEQPSTGSGRVPVIVTSAVAVGLLAGFAAGYGVAYRVIASAPPPTLVIAGPTKPPTADTTDTTSVPESASEPSLPTTRQPARPPVHQTEQRTTAAQSFRSSAARVATPPPSSAQTSTASNQTGVIEVMSRPRGAQVSLDGTVIGLTPLSIPDVSEGTHDVRVELEGFSPWTASVRVMGGSRARVGASLDR